MVERRNFFWQAVTQVAPVSIGTASATGLHRPCIDSVSHQRRPSRAATRGLRPFLGHTLSHRVLTMTIRTTRVLSTPTVAISPSPANAPSNQIFSHATGPSLSDGPGAPPRHGSLIARWLNTHARLHSIASKLR